MDLLERQARLLSCKSIDFDEASENPFPLAPVDDVNREHDAFRSPPPADPCVGAISTRCSLL